MQFQVVEDFHRPRQDRGGLRKDYKPVHDLGDCPSVEQARELAHIWYRLMRQSGNLGDLLVRDTRYGEVVRLQLQDEEGRTYPWAERPLGYCGIHDGIASTEGWFGFS